MDSDVWSIVTALSQFAMAGTACYATPLVLLGALAAWRQLREMAKARSLEALSRVLDELSTPEMSKARRYVLTHDLPPPGSVPEDIHQQMHMVWVSFDKVGLMVEFELIPSQLALEMYYGSIIYSWEKLEPYIRYERETLKRRYQDYFEKLYDRALRYKAEHEPDCSGVSRAAQTPTVSSKGWIGTDRTRTG